jgi:hypothetical protein
MTPKGAAKLPQGFSQLWPPRGSGGKVRRSPSSGHVIGLPAEACAAFDSLTGLSTAKIKHAKRNSPPWPRRVRRVLSHKLSRKALLVPAHVQPQLGVVEELAKIARDHEEAVHQLDVAREGGEVNWSEQVANLARILHPIVESLVEELNLDVTDGSPLSLLLAEAGWDRVSQTYVVRRLLSLLKAAKQLATAEPPEAPDEARPAHRPTEPFGESCVQLHRVLKPMSCGRPRMAIALFMMGLDLLDPSDLGRRVKGVLYWDYDALMGRIKSALAEARKAK